MKIVELTVYLEVPEKMAAEQDGDDTLDVKASLVAIDALCAAFPDYEANSDKVQMGLAAVNNVRDE